MSLSKRASGRRSFLKGAALRARRGILGQPMVNKGFIKVPDKPGLGITLNEAVVKQHLLEPAWFAPTPEWNQERSVDRQWS